MAVPERPAEVTIFYRTFRAMWNEEGGYDWEAEIRETIEHELEHHVAFLTGDDPMDEAERDERVQRPREKAADQHFDEKQKIAHGLPSMRDA